MFHSSVPIKLDQCFAMCVRGEKNSPVQEQMKPQPLTIQNKKNRHATAAAAAAAAADDDDDGDFAYRI